MTRFLTRRLLLAVPILIGVSVLVFVLLQLAPGSPVDALVGPYTTSVDRDDLIEKLGFDRPWPAQYATWLGQVLQGDLGVSISKQTPVLDLLWPAFLNTLQLAVSAALIAVVLGVALGALAARARSVRVQKAAEVLATVISSVPQYSLALVLIAFVSLRTGWFPPSGIGTEGLGSMVSHLVLPAVTSSLVMMGIVARMTRSTVTDVMAQPWVETMRARGMSSVQVARHVARNSASPVITVIGLQLGYLIGGVLFVEIVFAWPGLGLQIYNAIGARDYPIIQGGVLIGAVGFVLMNLVVDALNAWLDPRVRAA
jgi:peptide/nickel transport system permease protein